MKSFKPMKGDDAVIEKLKPPYMITPKYDGHRCLIIEGVAMTSALKPFPNTFIQAYFASGLFDGLDGELIVGSPTAPDVFRTTSGGVRRAAGEPDFTLYVFDHHAAGGSAQQRWAKLAQMHNDGQFNDTRVVLAPMHRAATVEDVLDLERNYLLMGYEGIMLRSPDSEYKYGRSTVNENGLLKMKSFVDFEAKIIGFKEQMENTNEKTTNNLGRGQRSSAKAGKVAKGTLGSFRLVAVNGPWKGKEFDCGTGLGLTPEVRDQVWSSRGGWEGLLLTIKGQHIGGYDLPRIPVIKSMEPRDPAEVE